MKNNLNKLLLIVSALLTFQFSDAQLVNQTILGGNDYSQTDATKSTQSIVVGDFNTAGDVPNAALHVNTNYLNALSFAPSYGSFGEVFRTDAPDRQQDVDIFSFWRLYTGSQTNEVEHLAIFNSHSWSIN